ncbi:Protein nipi-4 [Caenorhabditis elegans]|uniref:Protein nipi-4 n=1 Tax=Caenorhabditis elegans TaxID=6239 RepID=NIPI4_CAEEL|nr:Protein nipi-4 [Caenorhabditis elegans]O16262.3 RecName: Full=Protein nipi-4; AltName: Full=No induction of peptide after drechmeria infection protein 4 [Caenorhabditis elegans]CCD66964.1 Protein nipi-4 [Caenorhabditis elegans]|eukprot:NP_505028.3 Protein nipi-4 [Caenorhabditis elegans]
MELDHTPPPSVLNDNCSASYMTPYATVIAMSGLYLLAIFYFCKKSKKMCQPMSDSIYPYQKRLTQLERELKNYLIDEESIEVDDFQIGQTADGFIFRGGVFPKTRNRFNAKVTTAVKISFPIVSKSISLLEDALRLSKLDHPNLIRLLAVSQLSFTVFRPMIALEWLPGGTLADYFQFKVREKDDSERSPIQLKDMLSILYQVSQALKYIHSQLDEFGQELTHGRIFTRNVLVTEPDLRKCEVKLGDFGDAPMGLEYSTPIIAYMPPEILCCAERIPPHRPENDVWMFGVFIWECLTLGAQPHFRKSVEEIKKSFRLPDRGLSCPPTCPLDVWTLVSDCLSEPHMRPRFASTTNASITSRLSELHHIVSPALFLYAIPNQSVCTCIEHHCQSVIHY